MKKRRVQSKIGKLLFHRMGIVAVLIVAQIVLYAAGLVVLRDSVYFDRVEWLFLVLSVLAAMWIVGSRSNPGYKIGWLIIVLGLMPFGSLAYLLLGGNHLSAFNQRRLRSMERKIRKNLKNECGRSASLGELMGEDAACILDGNASEWTAADLLLERDGMRLSARYDAEGLYLLLEGVSREEAVYLPLDISAEVGSRSCASPSLTFQREADFVLCLDGTANSRLLVQDRWDSARERFLYETEGDDPFLDIPERDSASFVPVGMAVQNPLLVDTLTPETRALQRLGVWETGKLVHGNGDSRSPNYNSLADFCFGDGCVEIRLPWLLLNVGAPASMLVHRDYYRHYGVDFKQIRELWIGAARDGEPGEGLMEALRVRCWKSLAFRERLKESYYMVQTYWKGGD